MRRILLALLLALPLAADEPPDWSEFSVVSADGTHVALVQKSPDADPKLAAHQAPWILSVHRCGKKPGAPEGAAIWSSRYLATGYAGGRLSDDGGWFVQVEDWFQQEAAIVTVYSRKAEPRSLRGLDFAVAPSALKETASHRLWLGSPQPAAPFVDAGRTFEIAVIDGTSRWVDLESGKPLGPRDGAFRATLGADGSLFGPGDAVPVTFAILNASADKDWIWHADPWVNHRLAVLGPDGKEPPLTDEGRKARGRFGAMDRRKNAQFDVEPGGWDTPMAVDVAQHFRLEAAGRYEIRVEYADSAATGEVRVVSNPVAIRIAPDGYPSAKALVSALAEAAKAGDDEGLRAVLGKAGEKSRAGTFQKALGAHDFVAAAKALDAAGEDKGTIGGHDMGHLHLELVKMEGRWRVDRIRWCR